MLENKKYRLLIIWDDTEPELDDATHCSFEDLLRRAKTVRRLAGDKHGLYYLTWEAADAGTLEVRPFGAIALKEED